jgi:hypothetical protein
LPSHGLTCIVCSFEFPRKEEATVILQPAASPGELVRDIEAHLSDRNAAPKPYTWKAEGAAILEKINRARAGPR